MPASSTDDLLPVPSSGRQQLARQRLTGSRLWFPIRQPLAASCI